MGAATRGYGRQDLGRDVVAGLVLSGLLVPAGMGYATAAGLPAETGLYATVAALVAYALVGPSRVLVLGPDSSLAPLIAAAVVAGSTGALSEDRAVARAGVLALLVGAVLILGGLLRLGAVMDLLSKPIRAGYLNGVVLVVLASQLPKLLGFSVDGHGLPDDLRGLMRGIADGQVDGVAAAIGVGALALVVVLSRVAPRVPGLLVAMVGTTIAVWALDLSSVPVVGSLPGGLPAPALGAAEWGDVPSLLPAALGIALVAAADTEVLSRVFAARTGTGVDPNREMAALGVANVACGATGGFPVSASSSRTPVAQAVGARTQLTGVVGAAAVAALIVAAPQFTRHLPVSALAAIVIAAILTVADVGAMTRLWPMNRTDFGLSVAAFAGVALLGVLAGIAVAVGLSLLAFVARAWRPYMAELVRVEGRKGYHDRARHPEGRQVPGLVIVRFDAPLFFANAELFAGFVRRTIDEARPPVRWVAIAAEPITDVDTTAADVLARLVDELETDGMRLVFAEMKGPVKDRLARYGLADRFGPDAFYPTIGTMVDGYVEQTGTPWTDWTDEPDGQAPALPT